MQQVLCCIYLNLLCKKRELDPMGCCSSRPSGWKAMLALCFAVSYRKSLDLWQKQTSMQTSYAHHGKTPNCSSTSYQPCREGQPVLAHCAASNLRVRIHIMPSMEIMTRNEQALGISATFEIELRTVICPRSSEMVIRP